MNRFFRSALFPLIVIVLLVYLASQTLRFRAATMKKEATYSELIQVEDGNVSKVLFTPNKRQINATLVSGQKIKVNHPDDQSQYALQQKLEAEREVRLQATGSSAWWTILTSLLPFVLLFGFWIFSLNQVVAARGDELRQEPRNT